MQRQSAFSVPGAGVGNGVSMPARANNGVSMPARANNGESMPARDDNRLLTVQSGYLDNSEEDNVFYVDKILNKKIFKGKIYYLIHWTGFTKAYDTWEPLENLNCARLVKKYEKSQMNKRAYKKRKPKSPSSISVNPIKDNHIASASLKSKNISNGTSARTSGSNCTITSAEISASYGTIPSVKTSVSNGITPSAGPSTSLAGTSASNGITPSAGPSTSSAGTSASNGITPLTGPSTSSARTIVSNGITPSARTIASNGITPSAGPNTSSEETSALNGITSSEGPSTSSEGPSTSSEGTSALNDNTPSANTSEVVNDEPSVKEEEEVDSPNIGEYIVGFKNMDGIIQYLIKWQGKHDADFFPAEETKTRWPELILQFLEERFLS